MENTSITSSFTRLLGHRRTKSSEQTSTTTISEDGEVLGNERSRSWFPSVKRKASPSTLVIRRLSSVSPQPFALGTSQPPPIVPRDSCESLGSNARASVTSLHSISSQRSHLSLAPPTPAATPRKAQAGPPKRPARPERGLFEDDDDDINSQSSRSPDPSDVERSFSPYSEGETNTSVDEDRPDIINKPMRSITTRLPAILLNSKKLDRSPTSATAASPIRSRKSFRVKRSATQRSSSSRKKPSSKKKQTAKKLSEKVAWPKRLQSKSIKTAVTGGVDNLLAATRSTERPLTNDSIVSTDSLVAAHLDYLENNSSHWTRESVFLETGRWPADATKGSPQASPSLMGRADANNRINLNDAIHRLGGNAEEKKKALAELTPKPLVIKSQKKEEVRTEQHSKSDDDCTFFFDDVEQPKPEQREEPIQIVLEQQQQPPPAQTASDVATTTQQQQQQSVPPSPPKNGTRYTTRLQTTTLLPTIPENLLSPTSEKKLVPLFKMSKNKSRPFQYRTSTAIRPPRATNLIPRKSVGGKEVNWVDFQSAIMCGAGDLISGMAEDEANDFADDMADWFDTFGFETHGELVPSALVVPDVPSLQLDSAEDSQASSVTSDDADLPIPLSTLYEDHIVGTVSSSRDGSPDVRQLFQEEKNGGDSTEMVKATNLLQISRTLSSRFQTQKRTRSVSPKLQIPVEVPEKSPMSCNMNADLGQFLEWNPSDCYTAATYESPDDITGHW